jgi:hypothetical protein
MTPAQLLMATFLGLTLAQPAATDLKFTSLDLQSHANQRLKDDFHSTNSEANNLTALPAGQQRLDGIIFDVGESLIQLGCTQIKDKPDKVEGIRVDQSFGRLHILHAAAFNSEPNTVIGLYVIRYADGARENMEIVYGQNVSDWWYDDEDKEPAVVKIAWTGENEFSKKSGKKVRLYHAVWKNPYPEKKVACIDLLTAEGSNSAPFCIAMTVE